MPSRKIKEIRTARAMPCVTRTQTQWYSTKKLIRLTSLQPSLVTNSPPNFKDFVDRIKQYTEDVVGRVIHKKMDRFFIILITFLTNIRKLDTNSNCEHPKKTDFWTIEHESNKEEQKSLIFDLVYTIYDLVFISLLEARRRLNKWQLDEQMA